MQSRITTGQERVFQNLKIFCIVQFILKSLKVTSLSHEHLDTGAKRETDRAGAYHGGPNQNKGGEN